MGPGGIATIIAASALLVIAFAISYTVIRVGRVVDELQKTLKSVNRVVSTAESFTEKVTGSITDLVEKNSGLLKVIGSVIGALVGKKFGRSEREHE